MDLHEASEYLHIHICKVQLVLDPVLMLGLALGEQPSRASAAHGCRAHHAWQLARSARMQQWQHVCGAQQPPPFALAEAAAGPCPVPCSGGGHLALVIQPRHVAAPGRVDAVAWALLTLYAHVDVHVKRFKARAAPSRSCSASRCQAWLCVCSGRPERAAQTMTSWAARSLLFVPGQPLSCSGSRECPFTT